MTFMNDCISLCKDHSKKLQKNAQDENFPQSLENRYAQHMQNKSNF